MKLEEVSRNVVRACADYPSAYRHQLWIAVLDDITALGMGYRAYYGHIRRSLEDWRKLGTSFVTASGEHLNCDALTSDDLWGFLGKEASRPSGPVRKISSPKIAVIDVFLKTKYPELCGVFEARDPVIPLSAAVRNFFSFPGVADLGRQELDALNESVSGVYVPNEAITASDLLASKKRNQNFGKYLTAYIVNSVPGRQLCVVHRVETPMSIRYLRHDFFKTSGIGEKLRAIERHKPAQSNVWSGIAYSSTVKGGLLREKFLCILRDRTTYEPLTTELQFTRGLPEEENGGLPDGSANIANEVAGGWFMGQYKLLYGIDAYKFFEKELPISLDYVQYLFDLKQILGMEV